MDLFKQLYFFIVKDFFLNSPGLNSSEMIKVYAFDLIPLLKY